MGMHCALRGGVEQNNLRRPGCNSQLSVEQDERGIECLVYREDPLQKTNQGGLLSKGSNKIVYVYAASNSARCPIRLFKKYTSLLPQSLKCKKLYLRCRKKISPKVWYCDQPYGINSVKTTVKEVMKLAGHVGKFTNHSLRATCASRMFANDVPEQIIKEVMGHKSDCVRNYKRTSDEMRQKASNTLSKQHVSNEKVKIESDSEGENNDQSEGMLSVAQMVENVKKTKAEIRRKKFLNAKTWLSLKRFRRDNKVTIDVNVNIKK